MPTLNALWHVLAGVGGGTVSIDGVPLDSGGGGVWLTDKEPLYQCADGWYLKAYDQNTLQFRKVDSRGANTIIGGGGRYQVLYNGQCYGSLGEHPGWGVKDAGADGTLAICPNYAVGLGFELHAPDGGVHVASTGTPCYGLRVLSPTDAVYIGGMGSAGPVVTLSGRTFKQHRPDVRTPVLLVLGGQEWLAYYADDLGPVIHPALPAGSPEPLMGYILANPTNAYNFDVCAMGPNAFRTCWSTTQGEEPANVRWEDTQLDQPRVNLDPVIVEPPVPGEMPAIGRHVPFGFYYKDTYTDPRIVNGQIDTQGAGCPGDVSWCVSGEAHAAVAAIGNLIIDESCVRSMALKGWERVDAIYLSAEVAADPVGSMKRQRDSIRRTCLEMGVLPRPFITYTGGDTQSALALLEPDGQTIIGVQLYLMGTEGPDDLRKLAAAQRAITGAAPVALICQAYGRWAGYTKDTALYTGDLAALVPVYAEIVRDWPDVQFVGAFSWRRKGGLLDYPEVMSAWAAFAKSALG